MGDLSIFGAIAQGAAPVIKRTEINGLTVSTVDSWDCGPETAILDATGVHPVERYPNREAALIGHEKWVGKVKPGLTVDTIGHPQLDTFVDLSGSITLTAHNSLEEY